jgi:5-oxoprolinase (ATP-hydrolysing) subunit A
MDNIGFQINCDLGEGIGNDQLLMPLLDACSIACGGHAGDLSSMQETVALAMKNHVKIGAHPSFPDKENFGRKVLKMDFEALKESIYNQVSSLDIICKKAGTELHHIKAHGALYNQASVDEKIALAILDACEEYQEIPFFAPYQSVFAELAFRSGRKIIYEAFADRRYNDDLSLVERTNVNAVITHPDIVLKQVLEMSRTQTVTSISGKKLPILANTYCVHGDNPNALQILKALKNDAIEH